jgi:hypothetical protein
VTAGGFLSVRERVDREYALASALSPGVTDALDLITQEAKIDDAILDINLRGEMVFPAADLLAQRGGPFVFTTGYDLSTPQFAGCSSTRSRRSPC